MQQKWLKNLKPYVSLEDSPIRGGCPCLTGIVMLDTDMFYVYYINFSSLKIIILDKKKK